MFHEARNRSFSTVSRFALAASLLFTLGLAAPATHAAPITEDWTGTNGSAWPAQWEITSSANTVTIQNGGGDIDFGTATGTGRVTTALIKDVTLTDPVQGVDVMKYSSANVTASLLAVSENDSDSYYRAYLFSWHMGGGDWGNRVRIDKIVDGVATPLTGHVNVEASQTDYSRLTLGLATVDDTIELVLTYTNATDPENIQVTTLNATDETPLTGPFRIGVEGRTDTNHLRFVRFDNYTASAIPEPASATIGLVGLALLALPRRVRD